jgi:hypothetical protein
MSRNEVIVRKWMTIYLLTNNCYRRHNYYDDIGPSGRTPAAAEIMSANIRELEELGLAYKNTGAEWASPPLILPRPGPDQYRMTVDLNVPNASTEPNTQPVPNLQDELHDLHGSEVFATLDFCQGYWQIPLHKDSQDCQSFITPDGVHTPTSVLHGTRNATQHL